MAEKKILVRALLIFPKDMEFSDRLKKECGAFWDKQKFMWTVKLEDTKKAIQIAKEFGLVPTSNFKEYWDAFKANKEQIAEKSMDQEVASVPSDTDDGVPF